jgi:hypothetical protein
MESELREILSKSTAGRLSRSGCASYLIDNPEYIPEALALGSLFSKRIHVSAWWAMELTAEYDIMLFQPYIDDLLKVSRQLTNESALRSASKMCMLMIRHFVAAGKISNSQLQQIRDLCLDWLIQDHKVATTVFAMRTLGDLRKEMPGLSAMLQDIIQKDYASKTAGYKAAARDILQNHVQSEI